MNESAAKKMVLAALVEAQDQLKRFPEDGFWMGRLSGLKAAAFFCDFITMAQFEALEVSAEK